MLAWAPAQVLQRRPDRKQQHGGVSQVPPQVVAGEEVVLGHLPVPAATFAGRQRGERVEVKLRQAVDGQKVFLGVLVAVDAATEAVGSVGVVKHFGIEFEAKKGEVRCVTFMFSDVERAKLEPVLDFKGKKR